MARRPVRLPVASQEQFRAAGGQELQVQGRFPVKVDVEGREIDHEFYVIKDLNEPMIFGIDFIAKNELNYCASSRVFKWKGQSEWEKGYAKVQSVQTLLPLQASVCKVQVRTESGAKPSSKDTLIVNVSHPDNPLLTGGPYLVSPDDNGLVTVPVYNCSPLSVEIDRNEFIGVIENASTREIREINPRYLSAVAAEKETERTFIGRKEEVYF